jgi:hypothetical protein
MRARCGARPRVWMLPVVALADVEDLAYQRK